MYGAERSREAEYDDGEYSGKGSSSMTERGTATRAGAALAASLIALLMVAVGVGAQGRGPALDVPAPAISGGPWINSAPLTSDALRGRVVFVEFWTYG